MKGVLCLALMLIGTRPVQAQVVPLLVDGAQVRIAKRGICIVNVRCSPVRGTVARRTSDSVVVRVDRVRTGLLSQVTTGMYRDTLVVWTPASRDMNLEVLAGYRSRSAQGLTGMAIGGVVGAAAGLVLGSICLFCTPAETNETRGTSALAFGAFGAIGGLTIGLIRDPTIWKRVPRTGFSIVPLVSTIGDRSTFILALRFSSRANEE